MQASYKREWIQNVLNQDLKMHKLIEKAQNQAETTIDENVWARYDAEVVTDPWNAAVKSMNRNIKEKIAMETDKNCCTLYNRLRNRKRERVSRTAPSTRISQHLP